MCKKYYSYRTSINNLTGEAQTENAGLTWIYEPLKASNYTGCIAEKPGGQYDRLQVLRNIRQGPQPAHLFELPEGYKITEMPSGGMLELFSGKSRQESQKNFDDTRDAFQKKAEEIKSINEGSDKSPKEKIKALLEMFGAGQKKK